MQDYEQYQDYSDVVDTDGTDYINEQRTLMPSVQGYASSRELKRIGADTELAVNYSMGRALLSRQALLNQGILSHDAETLSQMFPSGANRFRMIAEAAARADMLAIVSLGGGDRKW